jgi:hypothetical protein
MWLNDPNCVPRSKRKYKSNGSRHALVRRGIIQHHAIGRRSFSSAKNVAAYNRMEVKRSVELSLSLQPEVEDMLSKSYSIPRMIKILDEKGLTPDLGGKWYVEGFRRLLKKVLLNKKAQELKKVIRAFQADNMSLEAMGDELNAQGILDSRGMPWDEFRIKVLMDRIDILEEVGGL